VGGQGCLYRVRATRSRYLNLSRVTFKGRPITTENMQALNAVFARLQKERPIEPALIVECVQNEIVIATTTPA